MRRLWWQEEVEMGVAYILGCLANRTTLSVLGNLVVPTRDLAISTDSATNVPKVERSKYESLCGTRAMEHAQIN
jgi:hypothetical protein